MILREEFATLDKVTKEILTVCHERVPNAHPMEHPISAHNLQKRRDLHKKSYHPDPQMLLETIRDAKEHLKPLKRRYESFFVQMTHADITGSWVEDIYLMVFYVIKAIDACIRYLSSSSSDPSKVSADDIHFFQDTARGLNREVIQNQQHFTKTARPQIQPLLRTLQPLVFIEIPELAEQFNERKAADAAPIETPLLEFSSEQLKDAMAEKINKGCCGCFFRLFSRKDDYQHIDYLAAAQFDSAKDQMKAIVGIYENSSYLFQQVLSEALQKQGVSLDGFKPELRKAWGQAWRDRTKEANLAVGAEARLLM